MPTPWTPSALGSALHFWYDPSSPSNYEFDGTGTLVRTLIDLSGNGNDAEQTDWQYRPTIESGGINGLDCMVMSAFEHFPLEIPSSGVGTFFVVVQTTDSQWIILSGIGNSSWRHVMPVENVSSGDDQSYFSTGDVDGILDHYVDGTKIANNRQVAYNALNGATPRVFMEGLLDFSLLESMYLCNYGGPGGVWNYVGRIGEIIMFNEHLSDIDRELVEGYLCHKWGTDPNMPLLHPFYDIAPNLYKLTGKVKDKFGEAASRKVLIIDESNYTIVRVLNTASDGIIDLDWYKGGSYTFIIDGEPDRQALVFNGVLPEEL